MKRTLRRESKAPETVGREAMDAGDPLRGTVRYCLCKGSVGYRKPDLFGRKKLKRMECLCGHVLHFARGV